MDSPAFALFVKIALGLVALLLAGLGFLAGRIVSRRAEQRREISEAADRARDLEADAAERAAEGAKVARERVAASLSDALGPAADNVREHLYGPRVR